MKLWSLLVACVLNISVAQAQINVVPVNGGTGGLVSIPIPGGSGLSVTVGTGSAALPLQEIKNDPNAVNITTHDDSYNNVPLGFDFPFYGRVFNNSWAMTNGLVTFQDPNQSGLGGACCEGVNLITTRDPRYNYTIYALHTDLYSWNGQNQYYLRGNNEMTYGWYGVSQCCSSQGGNSFEIKINSSGLVDTRIAGAMVSGNRVTSGMAGDLSKGEYYQHYHGSGLSIPGGTAGSASVFSWQALNGTGAVDACVINPLSSPSCPGYQVAYTTQQCTISALYDPSCPGYATAYYNQQCSINPLYNSTCPGYAVAFLNQQCSINPLYSTTCSGYQEAYHNQQCSINPLYSTSCPGYAAAYLNQQCSLNPLYSNTCSGYAEAYKAQQCSLDGLYDRTCPNYATAYATKLLLERQGMASNVATAGEIARNDPSPTSTTASTTTASASVGADGSVSVGVSRTGDTNIDRAIAPPPPTTNSAAAPAAPVQLVAPAPAPAGPSAPGPAPVAKNENAERPAGGSSGSSGSGGSSGSTQQARSGESRPAPSPRQELQARREAAARAEAVERGKNLANEMGKVADIESQKQMQNLVIQAMGFTPGFDNYSKATLTDAPGYRPYSIYGGQRTIDNRNTARMFGATDRLHQEMVNQQYK